MKILGIDPGLSGGVAFYDGSMLLVYDMPTLEIERNGKKKRQINLQKLHEIFSIDCSHCFLENVNAMPGQGVSSMFQMGRGYGQVEAMLAASKIPVTYITPGVWKKHFGINASKDGAIQRASQLMPQFSHNWTRKKDDGRAEAALIAYYGYEKKK